MARALLLVSLGWLLMPPAESVASPRAVSTRVLTDFGRKTPDLGWVVVNDGVMGGRSRGGFVRVGNMIDFTGVTNTNGGGFSSIRTRGLELDLGAFDGVRVRVLGDGRRYTWRLTTDARWRGRRVSYWADFETVKGRWIEADVPFSRFVPQWRGMKLRGLPLDPTRIRGMGLMIYDKKDGPFAIRLDSVAAYEVRTPFALGDVRWKQRVLVVSAPTADHPHLAAQLSDVERTRKAFRERDMLLVVLLDAGSSRAGDLDLTAAEAEAVREAVDVETGAFALRLVGKDGGVKRSATAATPMADLYALIDTMPMRKREMRR